MTVTEDVRALVAGTPGAFGVYARNLTTGERVEVDADRRMTTASAAKQFILVTYAEQVDTGTLDPETRVTVTTDDHTGGSGVLRHLAPGIAPTLDDLASLMMIVSDNVATNIVLRTVGGPDVVNACMSRHGLAAARVNGNAGPSGAAPFGTATARALAESFALVAGDTAVAERCRRILFRQQDVAGLQRRVPAIAFAHDVGFEMPLRAYTKPGGDPTVSSDAGLFVAKGVAWIVAVVGNDLPLSKNGPDDVGPSTQAAIGERLWLAWGPPEATSW